MRDNQNLGSLGRVSNEASQGWKQIGVETRFWFVEDEQARRARGQKRSDPQQVSQGAIGKFGRLQRPKQPVLLHFNFEPPIAEAHGNATTGKRIVDRPVERLAIPNLPDCLKRRG